MNSNRKVKFLLVSGSFGSLEPARATRCNLHFVFFLFFVFVVAVVVAAATAAVVVVVVIVVFVCLKCWFRLVGGDH